MWNPEFIQILKHCSNNIFASIQPKREMYKRRFTVSAAVNWILTDFVAWFCVHDFERKIFVYIDIRTNERKTCPIFFRNSWSFEYYERINLFVVIAIEWSKFCRPLFWFIYYLWFQFDIGLLILNFVSIQNNTLVCVGFIVPFEVSVLIFLLAVLISYA